MGDAKSGGRQSDILGQISQQMFNETSPVRRELLSQGLEALKTGGIGAQLPLINRAVEAGRSALSKTLVGTEQDLGRFRLAGTPFGQRIQAETRLAGEAGIAGIAPGMASEFVRMLPSFVQGQTQVAIQGQSAAAGSEATRIASENAARAQIMSALIPQVRIGYPGGG